MTDFFSSLFGHGHAKHGVECHAKNPNNCRWHETGEFAPAARKADEAGREDALTPAECELQRIKTRQAAENLATGRGGYWGASARRPAPRKGDASHLLAPAFFAGLDDDRKAKGPKLRTVEELHRELAKVEPEALERVVALGEYTDPSGRTHKTRVSPLTGKPVSEMCDAIINALMCGIKVSDAEIEAMPEWREAQRRYADYSASLAAKRQPSNSWSDTSKEREAVRRDVYDKMSAPVATFETNPALRPGETYAVEKGFRFDIVTGLPASGKNAAFADRLSLEHRSRLLDSDTVKRMLPGYADGLGANIVHDESTFINKDLLDDTFKQSDPKFGDNIVYPTLGNVTERLFGFIERARAAGYKVHLHFNDISPEKAKGRMIYRMISTGRYLPLRVFGGADEARKAYVAVRDYADTAEWCESGAGKGVEPRRVEAVVNLAPKTRAKSKPVAPDKGDLHKYGLFGYHGGAVGVLGGAGKPAPGAGDAFAEEAWLDGSGDDDVPEWLADDAAFWGENLGLAPSKPDGGNGGAKPQKKSGLSVDDILANFERRRNGGAQ